MRLPFLAIALLLLIVAISSLSFTTKKVVRANVCGEANLSESFDPDAKVAIFEDKEVSVPALAVKDEKIKVLGTSDAERWIEVDISEQKLKAWEGNNLYLESLVSTGLPWWPTPTGEFRVWIKLRSTKMEGGSGKYY
ncbi:MAG: L,D-transpeptidase, partial [Patescibacteria group bacterium]